MHAELRNRWLPLDGDDDSASEWFTGEASISAAFVIGPPLAALLVTLAAVGITACAMRGRLMESVVLATDKAQSRPLGSAAKNPPDGLETMSNSSIALSHAPYLVHEIALKLQEVRGRGYTHEAPSWLRRAPPPGCLW